MKLYGIAHCNTVKKARTWLVDRHHDIPFHDFKKEGIDRALVARWLEFVDWQDLLNRRGTTWRLLPDSEKAAVTDEIAAIDLMLRKPSVIKRPILETKDRIAVGFDEASFLKALQP